MKRVAAKFVPRFLTEDREQTRMNACHEHCLECGLFNKMT